MSFNYRRCINLDNEISYIETIVFPISRFSKYKLSIRFDHYATEEEAINIVERWLSKPVSDDYYDIIKDDLFHDDLESYGQDPCRGNLLGDCKFLEQIKRIDEGTYEIICGS